MREKWRQRERGEAPIFIIQVRHAKGLNESLAENRDERVIGGYFGDRINSVNLMQKEVGVQDDFTFSSFGILENELMFTRM